MKSSATNAKLASLAVVLPLSLLVMSPALSAQEPRFHIQTNIVVIPTLVRSSNGEVVAGLKADDFVIEDDGVGQPVHLDESAEDEPVSLVLLVQSGRRAAYEFPRIRGLGSIIVQLLQDGRSKAAILEFDSSVHLLQNFTGDTERIAQNLKNLQPGDDGAVILDALDYAVKMLQTVPKTRRRVLLLISETRDHGSKTVKVDDVVTEIGSSDTAVYALAFSPSESNVLDTMRGNNIAEMHPLPDLLAPFKLAVEAIRNNTPKAVSAMTGGEYETFATRKTFEMRMVDFTNHAHARYLLSIEPKDPHPGFHQLRVGLKDQANRTVLARSSYWATDATR
jgi:VWFA-related protein